MSFDLPAYLARIDMPARPTPDAAGLARLQQAHRLAIPFENLDIMLGRGIAIDGAAVFAKLVGARRGGYCFEQNRLFLDALAALDVAARPLLARVLLGMRDGDPLPPLTHTFSLVTIEGQDWVADPGFGASYAPVMPLVHGAEAGAPDGARFRLTERGADWLLERQGPAATTDGRGAGTGGEGDWQPQYAFALTEVAEADLGLGNWWTSTAPASRFRQLAIASIVLPHGLASLTDTRYRRWAAGEETAATITDPRVYRMRLGLMFGIALSVEEVAALGLF